MGVKCVVELGRTFQHGGQQEHLLPTEGSWEDRGWGGCLQTTVKVWRLWVHREDASTHEDGDRAPESNGLHVPGWLGSHSPPLEAKDPWTQVQPPRRPGGAVFPTFRRSRQR